jgi:hypothetical protein
MKRVTMSEIKIKKAFQAIVDFLENNLEATVTDIIGSVRDLAKSNPGGGGGTRAAPSVLRDELGGVVAILCSYHKRWELVSECDYGVKASSGTGLNVMCKEGGAHQSKQATEARKATAAIVADIQSGAIAVSDIPTVQVAIEAARVAIVPREDSHGWLTREDVPLDVVETHDDGETSGSFEENFPSDPVQGADRRS